MSREFDCSHCGQPLSADSDLGDQQAECPSCGNTVSVPAVQRPYPKPLANHDIMYCPSCGQQNLENNYKCIGCGFVLHGKPKSRIVVSDDNTMGGLIPYKNSQALWAYYLGIFSLIPCVGLPLGTLGLIFGIKGLSFAKLHPETGGKGHAWTGIILGGLCAVGNILMLLVALLMRMSA